MLLFLIKQKAKCCKYNLISIYKIWNSRDNIVTINMYFHDLYLVDANM